MADRNERTFSTTEAEADSVSEPRSFDGDRAAAAPDRNAASMGDVEGDLGAGTPANVDIHKLGQSDRPQEEWGEPAGEGATYSANHSRRGETDARIQGAKTRAANKDIVSRRD